MPIDFSPLRPTDTIALNGALAAPISISDEGEGLSLDATGILALAGKSGHARWTMLIGDGSGPPALDQRGVCYVATRDGQLFAVDLSGRLRWTVWLGARPIGAPAIGARWVAVALEGGGVEWRSVADGHRIAELFTGVRPSRAPIVLPDRALVVPTAEGELLKLDRRGVIWRRRLNDHAPVGVIAADAAGDVYAVTGAGTVARVGADGTLRWQVALPASLDRSPILGEDDALYLATDAALVAVKASTGERLWSVPTEGRSVGGPLLADDHVIYLTATLAKARGPERGVVLAIGADGHLQRRLPLTQLPLPGLTLFNHQLWIGMPDGTVRRFAVESADVSRASAWPKARGGVANRGVVDVAATTVDQRQPPASQW